MDLQKSAAEVTRLEAVIEHIQQERLTWAMGCECPCAACERLSSEIRKASRDTSSSNITISNKGD